MSEAVARPRTRARERILDSAYDLFSRRGIRAVGVDEVIRRAAVAKATLYRHFRSKDELVLAFLQQREQLWTKDWVETEARRRGETPEEQLLAIFDLFDEWFRNEDFEGCSFINVLLETNDRGHPVGRASAAYLENIRAVLRRLAEEADLREPEQFVLGGFHDGFPDAPLALRRAPPPNVPPATHPAPPRVRLPPVHDPLHQ